MNNRIDIALLFEFIRSNDSVVEVLNEGYISGFSMLQICPADQVPDDGLPYLIFLGRTAKNPLLLLENSKAALIIVDGDIKLPHRFGQCLVRVQNARLFVCELLSFISSVQPSVISDKAFIHSSAVIGERTSVGDFSYIGAEVLIGVDCVIGNNVTILNGVTLGDRVSIAPGVVVATDGFGYEKRSDGSYIKFPHIGRVRIGDDVEIGSNTVIDRGALGETVIENGVKIDNLVHISHNVYIGANSLVIANAMIAGSVKVGRNSWVGPSVNILDGVSVGEEAFLGMGVSVVKSVPAGGRFTLKNFFGFFRE